MGTVGRLTPFPLPSIQQPIHQKYPKFQGADEMTALDQTTERAAVKRYSLTMDGRRWDQLSRRARALNTSNTALINQLVEAYLNGPTALPTSSSSPNPMTSEAGMNMIGATYTAILDRLTSINRKVDEIRADTSLANECLQDDGAKIEQTARDVATMAAAFRRSRQGQQGQDNRPTSYRPNPAPAPGGRTITKEITPTETISAYTSYPTTAPASQESETTKRERLNRLAEATAANGGLFLRPGLPE